MNFVEGKKYLITTHNWFLAPDGQEYRAVYGTVKEFLGIDTNRHSTNWYVTIGDMIVAGCQVYYAIEAASCSKTHCKRSVEYEGKIVDQREACSRIYHTT